ncbi:chemotaxis protein CheA [Clostridium hydrogenum]|uniref:chemotaxis protein CheA n=1 Tax=Clostridium hydrogenum TaxID=2855764 RepID=UPI001F379C00|nr:chemotaxis protein CheA [Clostridium hydrogenum]
MNQILESYIEDLRENLMNLNEALMKIEKNGASENVINSAFRVAHTIKGNSAAMEFCNIEKVMHSMEDILQDVRSEKKEMTDKIINILYSCNDFLNDCLSVIISENSDKNIDITEIIKALNCISLKNDEKNDILNLDDESFSFDSNLLALISENIKKGFMPYIIDIEIDSGCLLKSLRAWLIFEVASNHGSIIKSTPKYSPEENLEDASSDFNGNTIKLLIITDKEINDLVNALLTVSEVTEVNANQFKPNIENAKNTSTLKNIKQDKSNEKQEGSFIRIPIAKVDSLMDMLSELLILNSQFEQQLHEKLGNDTKMSTTLSRSSKLIKEVQALSLSLKMIEIKPTLHRLHRIARDTAAELNKNISVVIEGEETEIDRSAAEKIFDPLMHLIRNGVSHGIEDEEERIKLGKSKEGNITIKSYSKRGYVYIEASDDGRGIDTNRILKKAIELNMADENKEYSDDEIIKFIFKPGFSTQEEINNISGRGVGMNVVEETIQHMGGKINFINTPGNGCTFIVKIPMNISVLNGTIIEVAGGRYIIPTLFIKEFYIVNSDNWVGMQGKTHALRIRDSVIPVISAFELLGIDANEALSSKREVVILEMDQKFIALPVDKILSRQEIVSKPLDTEFASINYASGVAILGDGTVSLILDVETMFKIN